MIEQYDRYKILSRTERLMRDQLAIISFINRNI